MFDRRISALDAAPVGLDLPLGGVETLLSTLNDLAVAGQDNAAPQQDSPAFTPLSLAERYAAANSITRRRFDAILSEAESAARTGVALIIARAGRQDGSTIATARFLGKCVTASLRQLDDLLAPRTA